MALSAPPPVAAYLHRSLHDRSTPEALQSLAQVLQVVAQGYDLGPETRRKLLAAVLETVPQVHPEGTTAPKHPLVPPTCVLLKLLGRSPAGTEQLARADGLAALLRLGGLERVAELPPPQPNQDDPRQDEDDEDPDLTRHHLAAAALASFEDDPLATHEAEALRCLANTLTLHPSARDLFPDVVLADQNRSALRGLVRMLACKKAGFLAGRVLFLLTSKPSDVIAELALGGGCVDAMQKFAEAYISIYSSSQHRPLLGAGPPTSTLDDVLKEHLKLAYNLMLQYARAPPSTAPPPFEQDASEESSATPLLQASPGARKKRFWRSKSSSSGTDGGPASGGPTAPASISTSTSPALGSALEAPDSAGSTLAAEPPRAKSPVAFAKRVVDAVKRTSPTSSFKEKSGATRDDNGNRPNLRDPDGEGNGATSLSLTAAHIFLPLFRPYLILAVVLPMLDDIATSTKQISPIVRGALNTLLNFPLELEELSGWSTSWLQYVPPRISQTDKTILPGGGIGSLGERLLEILRHVCETYFPADRAPSNPKAFTTQHRQQGRALEAPCSPDEWLQATAGPGGGDAGKVDEVLGPVMLLLRKLSMLGEAQYVFRELIFPSNADRTLPLDRQTTIAGYLVRLMSSILLPNTAFGVGELVYNLCDRSPDQLVQTLGYGLASGFLQNRQELIPPPPANSAVDSEAAKAHSDAGIDPITGAIKSRPIDPAQTAMSDDEKEREAERLYTLFERLARTGVVSTENPVTQAQRQGRFEETTEAREAELLRVKQEEVELEKEVEKDLREWRQARERSRSGAS